MSDLQLTEAQQRAVLMVERTLQKEWSGTPFINILSGWAGCGKTTVLKQIISETKNKGHKVVALSPTGKAALRISEVTGFPASTVHRWCYRPVENEETGEITFEIRKPDGMTDIPADRPTLVIIDEASMIGRAVMQDVYRVCRDFRCHILLVGDSFQLAPVPDKAKAEEPFSVFDGHSFPAQARVNLTEVMRQALDNPIIRASMLVRENKVEDGLKLLNEVSRDRAIEKMNEVALSGGVSLCYTNRLRHILNAQVRKLRGYGDDIRPNEPILVMKNCYDIERFNGEVLNFEGFAESSPEVKVYDPYKKISTKARFGVGKLEGDLVGMSPDGINGQLDSIWWKAVDDAWRIAAKSMPLARNTKRSTTERSKKRSQFVPFIQANLGYTLSIHKSQGSQYKDVFMFIEKAIRTDTEDGRRLLYTAATRAENNVYFTRE